MIREKTKQFWMIHRSPVIIFKFPQFRLEDLFEKSDMKMENGNMGSESSKKLKCCRENICRKIEVSRARCPSKLCCSLAFITL